MPDNGRGRPLTRDAAPLNEIETHSLTDDAAGTSTAIADDPNAESTHFPREHGLKAPAVGDGVTLADFYAHMPSHKFIFAPTGEMWPAASVNARIPPLPLVDDAGFPLVDAKGNPIMITASAWLDKSQPVEMVTWAPGEPQIVEGRLISDGGWYPRSGCSTFNLYRPPIELPGDATKAGPWLDHVRKIYPEDFAHIIRFLAHRVQHPGEKINHAVVLGGNQGVGKDTILEPVKAAIGPQNFQEANPKQMLGRFNSFARSVILRISEARDLGEFDRYGFYEHMKVYTAAPPDVLRVDEKFRPEYAVPNVCGVIITTNNKANGIHLPPDDRRHYVAWSNAERADFPADYWVTLYRWFQRGGIGHVAAYLRALDLSDFDPKAPPVQTPAFWDIVTSGQVPEDAELLDALEALGLPDAVTVADVCIEIFELVPGSGNGSRVDKSPASPELRAFLQDRKKSRSIPRRFEECGYVSVRNPVAKDGLYKVDGKRCVIYVRKTLPLREQLAAAEARVRRDARSLTSPTSSPWRGNGRSV